MTKPKPRSKVRKNAPITPRRASWAFSRIAHSAGVRVNATTPESTTAIATVTANWR